MTASVATLDLTALAAAIASGDLTSEAATTVALDRLETVGRKLKAVKRLDRTGALEAARAADKARAAGAKFGPLHGVPLAHKDLFYRKGDLSEGGAKIRCGFRAETTATVIERLDAAKVIASAVPELTGNRDLRAVRYPQEVEDVDVAVVRAVFGIAETGSVLFTQDQLIVNAVSSPSSWICAIRSPQSTRLPASAKPRPSVRSRTERGTSEVQSAI